MSSGELAQDGAAECVIFPVFFPVSREFGLEKSSHETASTARIVQLQKFRASISARCYRMATKFIKAGYSRARGQDL
jgi:hypothetical protein